MAANKGFRVMPGVRRPPSAPVLLEPGGRIGLLVPDDEELDGAGDMKRSAWPMLPTAIGSLCPLPNVLVPASKWSMMGEQVGGESH